MSISHDTTSVADRLLAAGAPTVLGPDDADFAVQVTGFNLFIRHTPEAVVVASSPEDVAVAVKVAAELDLPVTALGHGHGFPLGMAGGIAISTRSLAAVDVDVDDRTARVGAGTRWTEVIEAAAPSGLAPLCGSAPHVGVVGYLLGGGISPVGRTFGYAADHVRSIQVVTGGGELVVATPDENADLFWALRGGKGGLGIVTEVTIDLFPLPFVQAGGFFFDGADAATVVHAFAEWSQALPESVSTSFALLDLPPLPDLPEPIRGRFVVHVRVAVVGEAEAAAELVAPLRGAATPLMDVFGTIPYSAIGMVHSEPVEPMPAVEGGKLLRAFDREAADTLLAVAGPTAEVPLAAVEVRLLGGALSREPEVPNAVGGRDAAYSLHVVGAPVPELLDAVVPAAIDGVFTAMDPWATGGVQINFFGNANDPALIESAWPDDVRTRLAEIRDEHDPNGLFPYAAHGVR